MIVNCTPFTLFLLRPEIGILLEVYVVNVVEEGMQVACTRDF